MKNLISSSSFERALRTTVRRRPELQQRIAERLRLLAADPFNPLLRTHKLKGELSRA